MEPSNELTTRLIIKTLSLLFVFLAFSYCGLAQDNWELKRNENGIEVYTRKLNNGRYKQIKVLCEMKSSADQLARVLQDIDHQKNWSYATKSAYVVNRESENHLTYYAEIALPWPITNRDIVIELSFKKDSVTNILHIQARNIPGVVPQKNHLIRVPYSLANWIVTPIAGNKIKIEYTFSASPGGELPGWLVNLLCANGPYQSFFKLRKILEDQKTER